VTALTSAAVTGDGDTGRWVPPVDPLRFDTEITLRPSEEQAIRELGVDNLRRLRRHDPSAHGWSTIKRLLRPLDAVTAGLDSPPTTHRRRAMDDAVAVLLLPHRSAGPTGAGPSRSGRR
jgi:hypothetical protein